MDPYPAAGESSKNVSVIFILKLRSCKGLFWFLHNHDIIMGEIHYNVDVTATFLMA